MSWNQDGHGYVCRPSEVKIYKPSHTWAMKLCRVAPTTTIHMMTYSLDHSNQAYSLIHNHPMNLWILCNAKFADVARSWASKYPGVKFATLPGMHSKVAAIAPGTLYIGSDNLSGVSHGSFWHETSVGVRAIDAYTDFMQTVFHPAWEAAVKI